MKKELNLYHQSCHPAKFIFSFKQLIALAMACVLLVILVQVTLNVKSDETVAKKELASSELSRLQSELSQALTELQSKRAPQDKVLQKQRLSEEVATKQRLFNHLNDIDLGLVVSFSELLLGLSKADSDEVSISSFSINNGKLDIYGEALNSDSVPLWLVGVQDTTELKNVAFTDVAIMQEDNIFSFQLSHVALEKKAKDKK